MKTIALVVLAVVVGAVAGSIALHLAWRGLSALRRRRAGPRRLRATHHVIWRDPGEVERIDFVHGPGGSHMAPAPPFRFLEENASGSHPCLSVLDARGRRWRVKWGHEVHAETFAVRIVSAAGYFAETTYFVPAGSIEGVTTLGRARDCVAEDGSFRNARFELDDPAVRKLFDEHSWAWNENPFVGTRELNGLKVLIMLLANWDNKDVRDVARGSNTAIFEHRVSRWRVEARYLIIDWGAAMGRWGSIVSRGRWDPAGFEEQTPAFVLSVDNGAIQWGYGGQRTADAAAGISVEDVQWLVRYVGRVSDDQIRRGLEASGATPVEVEGFTRALRTRIERLREVSSE